MLGPEGPGNTCKSPKSLKGTTSNLYIYTDDVDALFQNAVKANAKVLHQPENEFWGDRVCILADTEGHVWAFATHVGEEKHPESCTCEEKKPEEQKPTEKKPESGCGCG
jgi:uncharacterized glyoxalase superfamily protein PhnB